MPNNRMVRHRSRYREIATLETLPEVTGAIEALTHAILDVLEKLFVDVRR